MTMSIVPPQLQQVLAYARANPGHSIRVVARTKGLARSFMRSIWSLSIQGDFAIGPYHPCLDWEHMTYTMANDAVICFVEQSLIGTLPSVMKTFVVENDDYDGQKGR